MGEVTKQQSKHTRKQCSNYTLNSVKEINVRIKSDKPTFSVMDMCQIPDGTILLINDCKLKMLNDQLHVKDDLAWKAEVRGLCSVSATEVAVKLADNTIRIVSVGKSLTAQRKVTINNENSRKTKGMACCNNQFWIPGADRTLYVYSQSGRLVKEIKTDSQGRQIFTTNNPQRLTVSNDGAKVYVAAYGHRVVVFNNNGDVITELREERVTGTYGVCVTDDDIVLVAGNESRNVVMFDRDGNSLGELVSSTDMLHKPPWPLCYDKRRRSLLVGYNSSDKVQVFQLTK